MRARYNSLVQEINTKAMIDCLHNNRLTVKPSFDFGFQDVWVHKYTQVE